MTVGVHFSRDKIVGDQVHNQLTTLPATPTAIELRAVGSARVLAKSTSEWLRVLATRGYAREEWVHEGAVYTRRYVVADTGEPLAESYDHMRAPSALAAKGAQGVRVRELGSSDRIVPLTVEY
ncbi:hypothetical protein [Promicromonospora soli]|nr:hypothetical protein [Promicromonospora soli]